MRRRLDAFLLAALLAAPAAAQHHGEGGPAAAHHPEASVTANGVTVSGAWVREAPLPGGASAAYFTVDAAAPDRLLSAASPAAARAALHGHEVDAAGVARMRPVGAVEVAPGAPVALEPGGLHLMLMGLAAPLAYGDDVPLTLVFERAGEVTLQAPVLHSGHGAAHGAEQGHTR